MRVIKREIKPICTQQRRSNWYYHGSSTVFIAQYKAVYKNSETRSTITNVHIQPEAMQPIEFNKMVFSNFELRKFALNIIQTKSEKDPIREEKTLGLRFSSIMSMS